MLRVRWMLLLVFACGQFNEIITEFQHGESNEELESSSLASVRNRECLENFQKIISNYLATDFTVHQDDIVTVRDMQRSIREMNATIEKNNEEIVKKNRELNNLNLLVEKMKNDFKSTLEMCGDLKTSKCNISCLFIHEARVIRVENPYTAVETYKKLTKDLSKCLGSNNKNFQTLKSEYESDKKLLKERETLLWRAAENGVIATVQNLISIGVNINATDGRYAMSTLTIASVNGHTDVVKLLIATGANLNAKDRENNTALILASMNNHTNIVKLLIDSGADVNAQSNDNNTAMIWASKNGHTNVVQVLINAGANITIRNGRHSTALLSAVSYNRTAVVKILLKARKNKNITDNVEVGMSLKLAVQEDNVEIARMLLDSGVDVNFVDNTGNTPLHIAVSNRKMNSIHLLVSRGANLQARNNENKTPLAIAESKSYFKILKYLIPRGAVRD